MWHFILLLRVKQILKDCTTAHSSQMHKELVFHTTYSYTEKPPSSHREAEKILWIAPKLTEYLLPNTLAYCLQHWWVLQEIKNKKYKHIPVAVKNFLFSTEKVTWAAIQDFAYTLIFRMSPDTRWHTISPKEVYKLRKSQVHNDYTHQILSPEKPPLFPTLDWHTTQEGTLDCGRNCSTHSNALHQRKAPVLRQYSLSPTQRKHNSSLLITHSFNMDDLPIVAANLPSQKEHCYWIGCSAPWHTYTRREARAKPESEWLSLQEYQSPPEWKGCITHSWPIAQRSAMSQQPELSALHPIHRYQSISSAREIKQ